MEICTDLFEEPSLFDTSVLGVLFDEVADTIVKDLQAPRDDIYTLASAVEARAFLHKAGVWTEVLDHDLKTISAYCPRLIWLMSAKVFQYGPFNKPGAHFRYTTPSRLPE